MLRNHKAHLNSIIRVELQCKFVKILEMPRKEPSSLLRIKTNLGVTFDLSLKYEQLFEK